MTSREELFFCFFSSSQQVEREGRQGLTRSTDWPVSNSVGNPFQIFERSVSNLTNLEYNRGSYFHQSDDHAHVDC